MNKLAKHFSVTALFYVFALAPMGVATEFIKTIDKTKISPLAGVIDPYNVRFTQDTISAEFSDGTSVFEMIKEMRAGKIDPEDFPAIRIFVKDGIFYSVDNRRLFLFQQVGAPIKYEIIATPKEILRESFKFTTVNDGREIIVRTTRGS